jgi:hypothetical protein
MSNFSIRDLVIRVSLMRPDLDAGQADRFLQIAAKRVFRESMLGQVISTVWPIPSHCNQILLTAQLGYWSGGLPNYLQAADNNKLILPSTWEGSTADYLSGVNPAANQKTAADVLRVLEVRTVTLPYFSIGSFLGWAFANGNSVFKATISGTTLTVQSTTSGTIGIGQYITLPSYTGTAPPYISAGTGPYTLSNSNLGTVVTSTTMYGNPVPAANNVVNGGFYIVYQGTVISDSTGTLVCKGGDVLQSNQTSWSLTPLENYDTLNQINWQTQNVYNNRPKSNWNSSLVSGTTMTNVTQAQSWSQRAGQIQSTIGTVAGITAPTAAFQVYSGMIIDLYPSQGYPTAMEITYAATPIGDISDILLDLPDEARDAIVHHALADWLEIPGKEQNLILAENHRQEYERLKGALRTLGALGMGGSAQYRAPLFGGRGNRYFPYFYNPTLMPGPN